METTITIVRKEKEVFELVYKTYVNKTSYPIKILHVIDDSFQFVHYIIEFVDGVHIFQLGQVFEIFKADQSKQKKEG